MPIESSYPPIAIPAVDVWTYFLERPDREYPEDHVLFVDVATGRKLTYALLRSCAKQFGSALQERWQWRKGDVLAIMTPNDIDVAPATFGALLVGGVVCPLNFMYTVDELVSQLTSSKAKGLLTNVACLEVACKAASKFGLPLDRILLVGNNMPTNPVQHFSSLKSASDSIKRVEIDPKEDLAYLVYSSGTTGEPKGVMLTHENIVANSIQATTANGYKTNWKTDTGIGFLPMYHIYGIAVLLLTPIFYGVTTHIMQTFDLKKFCETVDKEKVTIAYIVPPVALALAKAPIVDQYNLKSLRDLHSSAAPIPVEIITAIHKRLGAQILQVYGLSEAAPAVSSQRIESWSTALGTSGRLLPNMSAKVVSDGNEMAIGEEGELCLKGPNIFKGYYNNHQATAAAFDAEGWYHTGDVGKFDELGNLYITDRVKELIKYNGFQVAPAQLEALFIGHPAVADVAVIGVYSESRVTELPRAYIVVAAGYKGDGKLEEELHHWFNERVSPHKKLRGGIRFVEAVPKSNAGKILRRVLVEQAKSEEGERTVKARL
ncbi:putative amp-binding enzyme [Alternaria rosae]|uniref:putative amp-binding enzyme n=1 Tax=Alternaria rosae TaxID=1187941 RepID=UPI001E8EEFDA|nr:putative amp-binding enzyme [Alternaria rosae]KAH6853049.1 putative amp-binding enzyme [Alternaria rosae]